MIIRQLVNILSIRITEATKKYLTKYLDKDGI